MNDAGRARESVFSLGTSFSDALIEELRGLPVDELYGKIEDDGYGGGRHRFLVPKVGWRGLERHIAAAKRAGITFSYLLNSAATASGDAATHAGHSRLRKLLDRLVAAGVDAVTVVSPFFLRVIRAHTPLEARVSVFARVDDERKALAWFDAGARRVVLDSMLVNRDPARLERIMKAAGSQGELELLVNNRCEIGCAWAPCHAVDMGAASVRKDAAPDACFFHCQAEFLSRPERLLTQDWIRPEDLRLYENLGYRRFKIAGRGCSDADLLLRARAYAARRHDGNLVDLMKRGAVDIDMKTGLASLMKGGLRRMLGLGRIAKTATDFEERIGIDNRALDGFMDKIFAKGGCLPGQCRDCDLCGRFAGKAVNVPAELVARANHIDQGLVTGAIWKIG